MVIARALRPPQLENRLIYPLHQPWDNWSHAHLVYPGSHASGPLRNDSGREALLRAHSGMSRCLGKRKNLGRVSRRTTGNVGGMAFAWVATRPPCSGD